MSDPNDRRTRPLLPSDELNPLLNPLLAQHMDRWAEVYFTSASDRREEAVQELVRELEAEQSQAKPAAAEPDPAATTAPVYQARGYDEVPPQRAESLASAACPSCGHENLANRRFCGMCGARLVEEEAENRPESARMQEDRAAEFSRMERSFGGDPGGTLFRSGQFGSESVFDDAEFGGAFLRSRRVLIAGTTIVLIAVLAYLGWHGRQFLRASQQSAAPEQAPPSAQASPGTSAPATPSNSAAENSAPPATTAANSHAAFPPISRVEANQEPVVVAHAGATHARVEHAAIEHAAAEHDAIKPAAAASAGDTRQNATPAQNGFEELVIAQNYLKGGNGQQRDSAQAAEWLWKAVGKRNLEATLLLSDLYLHGDGVSKNCDQARMLLDAAAGRGNHDAGTRLRNLPAFGCQ